MYMYLRDQGFITIQGFDWKHFVEFLIGVAAYEKWLHMVLILLLRMFLASFRCPCMYFG